MKNTFGILSYGAYIPKRRLQRAVIHDANKWFAPNLRGFAKGEKAIGNWDEDSVTMAVEAGRDCLAGFDRADVDAVSLASTTLPFIDRLNSGLTKEALTLSDTVAASDATGSQRAGTSSLMQAFQSQQTQLCLASDARKARPASEGEMMQGDAAAAMLIGNGEPIATLIGAHSVTIDFVDHFRQTGDDFDYAWEARWVRDEGYVPIISGAIKDALKAFNTDAADIDHVLIASPQRATSMPLVKATGLSAEAFADPLYNGIGYTGTAHASLMLAKALETAGPGETILLVGFGQGADVLLFKTTDAISKKTDRKGFVGWLANKEHDENYHRYLFHRDLLGLDKGMRAEHDEKQPGTTLARNRKAVLGLVGGRCTKTGVVQFPKSDVSVAQNDRAVGTQEDYPLAEKSAQIVTYTADRLTYSLDPPTYYGMIDFEGGGRMIAEFTDITPEDVDVGQTMRMVFRIKAKDDKRNFTKYFWKAVPVTGSKA